MRNALSWILAGCAAALLAASAYAAGDHPVRGHITKSGEYRAPTRATNPNRTQTDNYSSKPNMNPASGRQGTRTPRK